MTNDLMRLYLDLNQDNLEQIQVSLKLLKEKQRHAQKWLWLYFLLGEGKRNADYKRQLRCLKGDIYIYHHRLNQCQDILRVHNPHPEEGLLEKIDEGRVQADILMGKLTDEITRAGLG